MKYDETQPDQEAIFDYTGDIYGEPIEIFYHSEHGVIQSKSTKSI